MAGMALHWRTASKAGAPTFASQPHLGRPSGRATVRVYASFLNPHSILGVSPTADVKEVKRAFRKLALELHPDVCKSEDGHERFIALTQAYEMLLGRAEGKTDRNQASASSSSGWDFHDWYWNFRMQRSWEKHQRQAKAAAAATDAGAADGSGAEEECGRRPPPHGHAGFRQPEARANIRSQLAGLRHRAAMRANRPAAAPSPGASSSPSAPYAAVSGCSMDAENEGACAAAAAMVKATADGEAAAADHTQRPDGAASATARRESAACSCASGWQPQAGWAAWSWSWSWDETLESEDEQGDDAVVTKGGAAADGGGGGSTIAAAELHNQYTHVYKAAAEAEAAAGGRGSHEVMTMLDGHLGTVVAVANHAVPFSGGGSFSSHSAAAMQQRSRSSQIDGQSHVQGQGNQPGKESGKEQNPTSHQELDIGPEPEPFSNPFDGGFPAATPGSAHNQAHGQQKQRQHYARRRFAADSTSRESVSHQLAGLRRKATMKASYYGGSASGGEGHDAF